MKTALFSTLVAVLALVSVGITTVTAQTAYKAGPRSQMTLAGTSTLHDWVMTARSFTTSASMVVENNRITSITGLSMTLPVVNLKSEKDGLNENAWEALEYEDHKNIVFKMTSGKVAPLAGGKYQIQTTGNLTIAGNTRPITLVTTATLNADGSVTCTGTVPLKLSQFNIERPSFMLGTMSVGDALTLNYSVVLVK